MTPGAGDGDNTHPPICNFSQLASCTFHHNGISAYAFKSEKTGLRVGLLKMEQHNVMATVTVIVPTPHLTHDVHHRVLDPLVSSGSEAYPWKTFLDSIGERRLLGMLGTSPGMEEMSFTMETAGGTACCNLLPVYLDRIFFPMMKDATFASEIHHVDGEGKDGGWVHLEMESNELSQNDRPEFIHGVTKRILLGEKADRPETDAPWGIERYTNLLRAPGLKEEIKAFHGEFYRPENVIVVVSGNVEPGDLLDSLYEVEMKLLAERAWDEVIDDEEEKDTGVQVGSKAASHGKFGKNRVSPLNEANENNGSGSLWDCFKCGSAGSAEENHEKLASSQILMGISETIEEDFWAPSLDGNKAEGTLEITWQGPVVGSDSFQEIFNLNLLVDYLASGSGSPVAVAVEKFCDDLRAKAVDDDTYTSIPHIWTRPANIMTPSRLFLRLHNQSVPKDHLQAVAETIVSITGGMTMDAWNQESMRCFLEEAIDSWLEGFEWHTRSIPSTCLANFLTYWEAGSVDELAAQMDLEAQYKALLGKGAEFWVGLMQKYFGKDKPRIVVRGHPSVEHRKRLESEKEERVSQRLQSLTTADLEVLQKKVNAADAEGERKPPAEAIQSFPLPDLNRIPLGIFDSFSNFEILTNTGTSEVRSSSPFFDLAAVPFRTMACALYTRYVWVHLITDTSNLPEALRLYIPLFLQALQTAPMKFPPGVRWEGQCTEPVSDLGDCSEDLTSEPEKISVDAEGRQTVPSSIFTAEVNRISGDHWCVQSGIGYMRTYLYPGDETSAYACLTMRAKPKDYSDSIRLLRNCIFYADLQDLNYILTVAQDLVNRTSSTCVTRAAETLNLADLNLKAGSDKLFTNPLKQEIFLKKVVSALQQSEEQNQGPEGDLINEDVPETSDDGVKMTPDEVIEALTAVQRFFQDNMKDVIIYIMGNLEGTFEANGIQLQRPLLDVLLPSYEQHCGRHNLDSSLADLKIPYPVVEDWMSWDLPSIKEKDGKSATSPEDPSPGCVICSEVEDDTVGAVLMLVAQVDFDPWVDVGKRMSLQMVFRHARLNDKVVKACVPEGFGEDDLLDINPEFFPSHRIITLQLRTTFARNLPEILANIVDRMDTFFFGPAEENSTSFDYVWREFTSELWSLDSPTGAIDYALLSSFRGVSPVESTRRCLEFSQQTSWQEVRNNARPYLRSLLSPRTSRCGVVLKKDADIAPDEFAKILEDKCGWQVKPYQTMADYFQNSKTE